MVRANSGRFGQKLQVGLVAHAYIDPVIGSGPRAVMNFCCDGKFGNVGAAVEVSNEVAQHGSRP
jgi:hypothetical protein